MPRKVDLTGKRIGKLVVVDQAESRIQKNGDNLLYWNCQCDCGGTTKVMSGSLIRNKTQSCGCDRKYNLTNLKEPGYSSLTSLISSYRLNAKKRNLEFKLNREEFQNIIVQNCFYCNISPSRVSQKLGDRGSITYNGVDRVDSQFGYIQGNCVPCCSKCNWAKSDDSLDEFLNWIKRTSLNLTTKGLI